MVQWLQDTKVFYCVMCRRISLSSWEQVGTHCTTRRKQKAVRRLLSSWREQLWCPEKENWQSNRQPWWHKSSGEEESRGGYDFWEDRSARNCEICFSIATVNPFLTCFLNNPECGKEQLDPSLAEYIHHRQPLWRSHLPVFLTTQSGVRCVNNPYLVAGVSCLEAWWGGQGGCFVPSLSTAQEMCDHALHQLWTLGPSRSSHTFGFQM